MVIEVPADDLFQPVPCFRNRLMPAFAQFRSDTPKLCRHPLAHRLTMHRELALLWIVPQNMGEPQKIERFRFPLPFPCPVFHREPPELNQACLVRVKFQSVVRQPLPQLLQKPLGLLPVLEPKHKVVRISNDHYIAECILPAPLPDRPPLWGPQRSPIGRVRSADRCSPATVRSPPPAESLSSSPTTAHLRILRLSTTSGSAE